MAKSKKRKDKKTNNLVYSKELHGLILILIAIVGIGRYGPVGRMIYSFAMFLVGTGGGLFLASLFVIGAYTTIKGEWPSFFVSRLVGLYLFIISMLVFAHIEYVKSNDIQVINIFTETINNLLAATAKPDLIAGGGVIGALFSFLFVKMFDLDGAYIVGYFLLFFGVIIFADISIIDRIKWLFNKIKDLFKINWRKKISLNLKEVEEKYEDDKKIIISSMDELTQIKDDVHKEVESDNLSGGKDLSYTLPPVTLLNSAKKNREDVNKDTITKNIEVLEKVLGDFRINGKVVEVNIGPNVTQYEMELKAGTMVSRLLRINREISLALAAKGVRIQAPIPGKSTVGVEIPNEKTTVVTMREMIESIPSSMKQSKLLAVLGRNIMGRPIFVEINNTPHLLIAGSTGSGKSVCINCIIASILMRTKPDEVKLLLIDPKKVELNNYNGIPHLLVPVVTDAKRAALALRKIVSEMDDRYSRFNAAGVKNIAGYNLYVQNKNKRLGEKLENMPYIIVIIDELADLMLVAAREVEDSITRITQLARAAGIHLIVATQRPSTDVITGLIKANIPSRISFAVSSSIDSRTILDMTGAEKLLGKGDMLFLPMGESTPLRLQGAFISEEEINKIINFVINQQTAQYDDKLMKLEEKEPIDIDYEEEYDDPLYNDIVEFIIKNQKASASLIQRQYRVGYNRAARIVDLLEERGIIGPARGSKPREVLIKLKDQEEEE